MKNILFVFLGGGIGSALRYGFSRYLNPMVDKFPLGTFSANILACLILGVASGLLLKNGESTYMRYFIIVGVCGGFSTFSTFALELDTLMKGGFTPSAIFYMAASIALGILAILGGLYFVKAI